jgi:hypothetical protein
MTGFRLRDMFAMYLIQSPPSSPQVLLDEFIRNFSNDCRYLLIKNKFSCDPTPSEVLDFGWLLIQQLVQDNGKTFADMGLDIPALVEDAMMLTVERVVCQYNGELQTLRGDILRLNQGQGKAFKNVEDCLRTGKQCMVFIDGPAGTGKTYLLNTLITLFKSCALAPVVVASSGVAAMLLIEGTTAHSGLRIPVTVHSDSTCSWGPRSTLAAVLKTASVLVWDEISMSHRHCVEAVNQSLQELQRSSAPFGGLSIIL